MRGGGLVVSALVFLILRSAVRGYLRRRMILSTTCGQGSALMHSALANDAFVSCLIKPDAYGTDIV